MTTNTNTVTTPIRWKKIYSGCRFWADIWFEWKPKQEKNYSKTFYSIFGIYLFYLILRFGLFLGWEGQKLTQVSVLDWKLDEDKDAMTEINYWDEERLKWLKMLLLWASARKCFRKHFCWLFAASAPFWWMPWHFSFQFPVHLTRIGDTTENSIFSGKTFEKNFSTENTFEKQFSTWKPLWKPIFN